MKYRFKEAHMQVAEVYAQLSYARRLKVGAIVVHDDNLIAFGYNGTPAGADNNCEIEPEDWDGDISKLKTKPDVVHAEANCLRKLKFGVPLGAIMFISYAPCAGCAEKIIKSGLKTVYYRNKYRDEEGIRLLEQHGIKVEQHGKEQENTVGV